MGIEKRVVDMSENINYCVPNSYESTGVLCIDRHFGKGSTQ